MCWLLGMLYYDSPSLTPPPPPQPFWQVTMDIVTRFFHAESCDIHLNHGDLLEAIWSWAGIKAEHREKVAEVYALLCL